MDLFTFTLHTGEKHGQSLKWDASICNPDYKQATKTPKGEGRAGRQRLSSKCFVVVLCDSANKGQSSWNRSSRLWWRPVAVVQKQMRRMLLLPGWSCAVWASASSPPIGECRWALQTPCVGPPPFDAPGEGEDRRNWRHSSTYAAELDLTGQGGLKRERKPEEHKIQRKRKQPTHLLN